MSEPLDVSTEPGSHSPLDPAINKVGRNVMVTYQEETKSLAQWSRDLGIPYMTLRARLLQSYWTVDKAFSDIPEQAPTQADKVDLTLQKIILIEEEMGELVKTMKALVGLPY